ncbi:MAG: hypothetical protein HYX68_09945 [Planctomycetes bacterium]|nr:hypothetical protein [Planctomycetota bacterium]
MTTEPTAAGTPNTQITEQAPNPAPPPPAASDGPAPASAPAAAKPDVAPTWPVKADYLLFGLLLVLSFCLAAFTATNSDLWMHLAIGKLISAGDFTFGVDPFSWATEAHGERPAVFWVHQSWLFSFLAYQLYNVAGGAGLVIGKAIVFTAAIALSARIGWNESNRWFLVICLVMAALTVSTRLFLQPMVLSYLFLAATLYVLYRAGAFESKSEREPDGRILWALPALFVLWVNLDGWFVLGPIVVGLCWAATGLSRWFRGPGQIPGKKLGLIFGVGVLACLINPYHVRAFQLPFELAYLTISATEPIGVKMPDELVAAGRTIKEMDKAFIDARWVMSPVSAKYWQDSRVGLHVAGLAFFPLLLMGMAAFTLVAFVRGSSEAPTLHTTRFLLWLFFAILGVLLYRVLPFFALVAAPLTAMTLGEFLRWQQTNNSVSLANRDRGLRLARLVSVPFLLLLLYLAWPGWLHGAIEYNSRTRVAFDIRPEPSLKRAAETLRDLHTNDKPARVFNISFEMGNYLSWFAPGVKYYADTRFHLFAGQTRQYTNVNKALIDPDQPREDWQTVFQERRIDHVAMEYLLTLTIAPDPKSPPRITKWWIDPDHWRQRYGDVRVFVFSWKGAKEAWPVNTVRNDWDRAAFGVVANDERPPAQGIKPAAAPTVWSLYLHGVGQRPVGVAQSKAQQVYFNQPSPASYCSFIVATASLAPLPALPGCHILAPVTATLVEEITALNTRDRGPPAAAVLAVRSARKAVGDNPLDAESYQTLADAIDMVRTRQEDHWIGFRGPSRFGHPSSLRDRLRHYQIVAARYQVALLQPDNHEPHLELAQLYVENNLIDLALEHIKLAEKAIESRLAAGKDIRGVYSKDPKKREALVRSFREKNVEPLEKKVKQRLAKFNSAGSKFSQVEQAVYAMRGPFQDFDSASGKVQQTTLGLGRTALDILEKIDPKSFKGKDQENYTQTVLALLLEMGRVDVVAENLAKSAALKEQQPLIFASYKVMSAGALGDYKAMDESLAVIEKAAREDLERKKKEALARAQSAVPMLSSAGMQTSPLALMLATRATVDSLIVAAGAVGQERQARNELCNLITLRGICALEAGDTKQAQAYFLRATKEAGELHFIDRPIALRYLALLKEHHK